MIAGLATRPDVVDPRSRRRHRHVRNPMGGRGRSPRHRHCGLSDTSTHGVASRCAGRDSTGHGQDFVAAALDATDGQWCRRHLLDVRGVRSTVHVTVTAPGTRRASGGHRGQLLAPALLDLGLLMSKRGVSPTMLRARPIGQRISIAGVTRDVLPLFASGAVRVVVDTIVPMAQAARAPTTGIQTDSRQDSSGQPDSHGNSTGGVEPQQPSVGTEDRGSCDGFRGCDGRRTWVCRLAFGDAASPTTVGIKNNPRGSRTWRIPRFGVPPRSERTYGGVQVATEGAGGSSRLRLGARWCLNGGGGVVVACTTYRAIFVNREK